MSTSYSNPQGTGERFRVLIPTSSSGLMGSGNAANLTDGSFATACVFANVTVSGRWIQFDCICPVQIDEAIWYQSSVASHGSWKWQGSNDGSTWTDIGSSFTLGGVATQTITALNGNAASFRFYRMLGVSGSADNTASLREIEFKVSAAAPETVALTTSVKSCKITMRFVRTAGSDNDGYADEISLTIGDIEYVVNGGAESATGGWNETIARVNAASVGQSIASIDGVGLWIFYGSTAPTYELTQDIDLSGVGSIDTLPVRCSSLLGGFSNQDDAVAAIFCFNDVSGAAVTGCIMLGPRAAGRSNRTVLLPFNKPTLNSYAFV